MNRVLVLGGYGGFGARLSKRLAADGWSVIVAGRNLLKARDFATTLEAAEAVRADREADLAPVLARTRPDLLVDCAGPFQGNSYAVPEACIVAGVHYTDLADAREFVCGIGALDEAAQATGVTVLAGGSTVPALTGAVLRRLTCDMERVDAVDMALGASTAATGGSSIARAVLSYAGKPVRVWRGRQWERLHGLHELQRRTYRVSEHAPTRRWVALADVPDLELVPDNLAGRPATDFRAGNESALQMLAARVLAGCVRRGWLDSLARLGPVLLPLQRFMARFGSARSAMSVVVTGWSDGEAVRRRWTVLADKGDGPEIPVLAAQLVARGLRNGTLEPGARDTSRVFDHDEFQQLFDALAVVTQIEADGYKPLYARVIGEAYDRLPEPVRAMHAIAGDGAAAGKGTVQRGDGLLARFAGWVAGFPPAGTYSVHVAFSERDGVETWTRSFGPHRFHSHLSHSGTLLQERFGPLRFKFALPCDETGLDMTFLRWSAFGIPLPRLLAPRIQASERADGEDFLFDVAVALPLGGPVVHYRGRLRRL